MGTKRAKCPCMHRCIDFFSAWLLTQA